MIVPLFLFNRIVNLNFTRTQTEKLHSLRRRAYSIIHSNCSATENDNIVVGNFTRQVTCIVAQKCLDGLTYEKYLFIILLIISTVLELETKVFCSLFQRLKLRLPDLPSSSWV